tara:strand:- start:96 stop:308 length:213 start_codon:yes stop_codon:yes gene_type:complete
MVAQLQVLSALRHIVCRLDEMDTRLTQLTELCESIKEELCCEFELESEDEMSEESALSQQSAPASFSLEM